MTVITVNNNILAGNLLWFIFLNCFNYELFDYRFFNPLDL